MLAAYSPGPLRLVKGAIPKPLIGRMLSSEHLPGLPHILKQTNHHHARGYLLRRVHGKRSSVQPP